MNTSLNYPECHRRHFLRLAMGGTAAFFTTPGAFAEALTKTPRDAEGPFYPDQLPLDTDNDLLVINDGITPAVGEITHLSGTVRDLKGNPLSNALVEIWQVDQNRVYLHSKAGPKEKADPNFQGYGRFSTNRAGEYYFRTIRPPAYPGRTPHIHVAVSLKGQRVLTTQCYIAGEKQNAGDFLYKRIGGPERQKLVTVDFAPIPKSETGSWAAQFDLVVGLTPED